METSQILIEKLLWIQGIAENLITAGNASPQLKDIYMEVDALVTLTKSMGESLHEVNLLKGVVANLRNENARLQKVEKIAPQVENAYQQLTNLQHENEALRKQILDLQQQSEARREEMANLRNKPNQNAGHAGGKLSETDEMFLPLDAAADNKDKDKDKDTRALPLPAASHQSSDEVKPLTKSGHSEAIHVPLLHRQRPAATGIETPLGLSHDGAVAQKLPGDDVQWIPESKAVEMLQVELAQLDGIVKEAGIGCQSTPDGNRKLSRQDVEKVRQRLMEEDTIIVRKDKDGPLHFKKF